MAWLYDDDLEIQWAKRIKITIDHTKIDSNLSSFPILIPITDSDVFDEIGDITNNWRHIAVTEDDGESQIDVEVEIWDHDNQLAWLHVLVPSISSSVDTEIYLYYDTAIDNSDWVFEYFGNYVFSDSTFNLVQHMQEVTLLDDQIPDSSANVNLATPANTPSFVDSQTGLALEFNGEDDGLDLDGMLTLTEFSIQILCKITDYTEDRDICGNATHHLNGRLRIVNTAANIIYWRATQAINLTGALPTDTYFLLTITRDGSNNWKVYQNDTDVTSGAPAFTEEFKLDRIGLAPDSISAVGLLGEIDEFRVYDYALTAAEIKATYNSLFDTLISFDSEEVGAITVPMVQISLTRKNPIMIPFYVKVPCKQLSLARKDSSWAWDIQRVQIKPVHYFRLGGAYTGQRDIVIPMSSYQIRIARVSARQFPSVNIGSWDADTDYVLGDIVKPIDGNGFRYKCIKAGTSYGPVSRQDQVDDATPTYGFWSISEFNKRDRISTGQRTVSYTSGGTYEIVAGNTIVGALSGARAEVVSITLDTGTWAMGTAAGTITVKHQTGTFRAENLKVRSYSNVATIAANSTSVDNLVYEFRGVANGADPEAEGFEWLSHSGIPFSAVGDVDLGNSYFWDHVTSEDINRATEPSWGDELVTESGVAYTNASGWAVWTMHWQRIDFAGAEPEDYTPDWPILIGATINDGSVVWVNIGQDEIWNSETAYYVGEVVYPQYDNGFNYICTRAGTTDTTEPTWPRTSAPVEDGTARWQRYQKTKFFVSYEYSVTIPNGPRWAEAIALRSNGLMIIQTGIGFIKGGVTSRQLRTYGNLVPITSINQSITANNHTITINGNLLGKIKHVAGERSFDIPKVSSYDLYQGKINVTHHIIYRDLLPGDTINLESESFEAGEVLVFVTPRSKAVTIKEF